MPRRKVLLSLTKNQFRYNSDNNSYTCPAGNILTAVKREKNRTIYATEACGSCPARLKCTTSIKGRSIHRYPFDEKKEKVVARMKQDGAKQLYTSRAGLVEPVFSMLRGLQQFNRFRHRGLASVRLEFSIQALAYNINRLITLLTSKNNPKPFPSVPKRAVIAISITFCSQIMKITCIWHFSHLLFFKNYTQEKLILAN